MTNFPTGNPEDDSTASGGNIKNKFRDSCEVYYPDHLYSEVRAPGDLISADGNALASSWIDFSLDPWGSDTESSITTKRRFAMPFEAALGLHMSQRVLGQEFSVELVSDDQPLPAQPPIAILNASQSTTTLTLNFDIPHGLVPGKAVGISGSPDSRLNYPALVVATIPSPTQITATAGPGGTIPSLTVGPVSGGSLYSRSRMGSAQDGVSVIFENATATNASIYLRSSGGDSLPSGTANGNHSVTMGSTASVQALNAYNTFAFQPTTEFKVMLMADRVQVTDAPVDGLSQGAARVTRTQVVPSPEKLYRVRIRGVNNPSSTSPVAKIVRAEKTGATTARLILDRPHNLTISDQVVVYGVRDQSAGGFPNLTAASAVTGVPAANEINVVIGTAGTVTSFGGFVAKVNGGNASFGAIAQAVQTATLTTLVDGTRMLTLAGHAAWAGFLVGDYMNLDGAGNAVNGATLGIDGAWKVRGINGASADFVFLGDTASLPADFVVTNCGGALIRRTSLRMSYLRVFDFDRERVEFSPRPGGDLAAALSVVVVNPLSVSTSGPTAEDAATTAAPVITGGVARTSGTPATIIAGDAVRNTMTLEGASTVKPYALNELEWNASLALTTTSDVDLAAAAGTGLKRQITSLWAINTGAALVDLILKDNTTERLRYPLPPNVGMPIDFPTGLQIAAANTAIRAALSAAGTVRVNATGYTTK
jgi:hypothetical protein